MSTVLAKKQMTEEDIKLNYITPAIMKGWKGHITMETKITDGRINIRGNIVARSKPKFVDYMLYLNDGKPIAVVEAKDNNHSVSHGLQQAMTYAQMMDLPFAYSSNGDAFYEHNFLTGQEQQITLDKFPTQDELVARYYAELNGGKGISDLEKKIVSQPYYSSQSTYPPRYYQRNAVNRTVEAIARGQQRLLLVMATGTGKTYTAFQIVYRLLRSDLKKRILYLADRNILVDQSIAQDFAPLEKTIYKVDFSDKECLREIASHEVNFALYHQMVGQNDEEHFRQIPPEYFDLIVVDECHRGSAKEDSNWRKVLEYFSSATQIGMTATPKESEKVSNIDYFGEPVYIYSLKQGIEDGFLAPFKVINITTNIGDGWRPYHGQTDIYGNVIEDRIYNNRDYDYNIILQDRINEVAREITEYLKSTDRMQKTIVFCASEDHAERMRIALINHNSDMVKESPDYCVRITGSDVYGKSKLDYFISVSEPYPVIATTSELLSTGADCKMTKLIVLDKTVESMTTFKQIIGRGTRIREKDGKTHFIVMDFRNVTRLFSDPDWDGPVEQDEGFQHGSSKPKGGGHGGGGGKEPPVDPVEPPIVDKDGCRVKIINKTVSVYDANGKLLRQEDIIDYTRTNIKGEYASLSDFIRKWKTSDKKKTIEESFMAMGIDLKALKADQGMEDVDDFDFICYVAYGKKPLTRKERANNVKKKDFFSKYSADAQAVLDILLDKYMNQGITEVEDIKVLSLADFANYGKPAKIVKLFGGKEQYVAAVRELEASIYEEVEVG
ncbi:EcoAI/FtnUII family type I restriction enzme subunit R [Flavonifractor plautii]|uniref:Type-1 restriction enzyme R protein n=1 Tax=Flavonifractor plautii TaxID=292800 RepID=A0A174A4L3_FLAPL|nr:DEAD/DEAH box helicase family protein [Flavonifractor plautii]ERI81401.1 putative type-I restriction enzyme [Clostridium sp. ATCC BAA-442]MDB7921869.1 DEAD/DEAH box helicase family protein [Flavonifractor plautii]MDB7945769.1 DEAD/DEAH box helicase family protein [Flavonifractor plautii]CUN82435.1 Type-1 restriction enzyme R protein [Flavonifractor plautii]